MRYRQGLVWLLGAVIVVVAALPVLAGPEISFKGDLTDLDLGTEHVTDGGSAIATATVQNGRTIVRLNVKDLDGVGGTFGAHVHVGPCRESEPATAGPHYTHSGSGPLAEREIWLDFTVTRGGTGHAVAIAEFEIDPGTARSIVIHVQSTAPDGTAGARMACLPLEF